MAAEIGLTGANRGANRTGGSVRDLARQEQPSAMKNLQILMVFGGGIQALD
ncbi:hypothetical protein [Methylorubrum extorquens]|uniref:hypothetical protein n=1 Tax=Methylorubrum extorquens TaxID=408 RepID=UPI002238056F|nr:hypothetical protein [Methylorubrum extorquens]UYW25100.1 hypothetical protein OKC48_17735 [Methylorubrum extorquens]UYW35042.1 hypothetical protein OKB92_13415 [Methylorubrum extorquens]